MGQRPPGQEPEGSRPLIYDVDGNAAEWATTGDRPLVINGSVLTLTDPKDEKSPSAPKTVTGLRVGLDR